MCGIIGIASNQKIINKDSLVSSRDLMSHRGPDDSGVWWSKDSQVGFAHRRLSIIDLTEGGHQPMISSKNDLAIIFNGEIYNFIELKEILGDKGFKFSSNSDTEVILAAYKYWGNECVDHFTGMFSFAIYDSKERCIFLARDRMGEKPLYFVKNKDKFLFSSEIRPLIQMTEASNSINKESMNFYLSMGFVPNKMTLVDGILKLPPAHFMKFDLNQMDYKIWKYWEPPEYDSFESNDDEFESNLTDELERILDNAVRKQLRSDVPIGVLLSGGVDSSLITALASRHSNQLKTFTIGFQGSPKYDESFHAKLIADHFRTEHFHLDAQDTEPNLLFDLMNNFDDPIIDSSILPTYLVSNLVSKYCKVVLGGDGGDELFGGYKHYGRLSALSNRIKIVPTYFLKAISNYGDRNLPIGFRGRNWIRSLNNDFESNVPQVATFFDPLHRRRLIGNDLFSSIPEEYYKSVIPHKGDLIGKATRMDLSHFLPEDILVKVDRVSMLNSLEVRAPFLDHHVVDFAFSKVPSKLKTNGTDKKILLKNLTDNLLPDSFDRDRKQGFEIPINNWLRRKEWKELFSEIIFGSPIYDKDYVNKMFLSIEQGKNNGERLFGLAIFESWRTNNKLTF